MEFDDELVEALSAVELTEQVLERVRDDGRPTRMEQLGWLAGLIAEDAEGWRASLDAGAQAVRRRWKRTLLRSRPEGWIARGIAALYREWGVAAMEAGQLERARQWHEQSLELYREVLAADAPPVEGNPQGWAGLGWSEAARGGLGAGLLEAHVEQARAWIDMGDLDRARLHWQLVVEFADLAEGRLHPLREGLAERWASLAEGLIATGSARGVQSGYDAAVDVLCEGVSIEPDAEVLHGALVGVGVRAAMWQYALGDVHSFRDRVAQLTPSAYWLDRHAEHLEGASAEALERLAQAFVCVATQTEHPRDAVAALRRALELHPEHPTARGLLGQALAALAARCLGRGEEDAARAAAEEAMDLSPRRTQGFRRLLDALDIEVRGRRPGQRPPRPGQEEGA